MHDVEEVWEPECIIQWLWYCGGGPCQEAIKYLLGNDCGGPTYKVKLIYVNHRLQDIEAASWCPSFFYTSEDQIVTGFVNGMLLTYIKGLKGVVLLNPFEMQWNLGAKNSSFLKKVTGSFASIKRLFRNYAKPLIQPPIIV